MTSLSNKAVEMTINLGKLARKASWRYKAPKCIYYLKKFIQNQFKSENDILIAPEVNKYIWRHGIKNIPKRMRIKVERRPSNKNPELNVFRVCLVDVNTFKGLQSQSYAE